MPEANVSYALAQLDQQPGYNVNWHPYAMNTSQSTVAPIGSVMGFTTAGVGANPGPGGDRAGGSAYTVAEVDLSVASAGSNPLYAGVLVGTNTWGATTGVAPNTITTGLAFQAMCAFHGVVQVLCDATNAVIGHTINISATVAGVGHDSGGTTWTAGTTIGTALQAVTISSGTALVWVALGAH
jgi:hypothetical protein